MEHLFMLFSNRIHILSTFIRINITTITSSSSSRRCLLCKAASAAENTLSRKKNVRTQCYNSRTDRKMGDDSNEGDGADSIGFDPVFCIGRGVLVLFIQHCDDCRSLALFYYEPTSNAWIFSISLIPIPPSRYSYIERQTKPWYTA